MNETNLDHLLQVTGPRPDWGTSGPVRSRDDRPAFDDHLVQASTAQAPSEPVRPTDAHRPENNPPVDGRPQEGGAHRIEGDDSDDSDVAAEDCACADDTGRDSVDGVAAKVDFAAADVSAETDGATQAGSDEQSGNDADEADDASEIVAAVAIDAGAAAPAIVPQLPVELTIDAGDETAAASGDESTEPNAADNQPTYKRQPSDGSQPVQPVGDPETFNYVLEAEVTDTEALQTEAAADNRTDVESPPAKVELSAGVIRHQADASSVAATAIANGHRPTTTTKRQRPPDTEPAATVNRAAKANIGAEEQSVDQNKTERQADKADKAERNSGDSRGNSNARSGAGRARVSPDITTNNGKFAVVAAVTNIPTEAATEATNADATDEAIRPAPPHGQRSDGLLHPLAKLQRGGGAVARSHRSEDGQELPRVDSARFVGRVAKAFHTAQERGGTLQLRLSPPELGALRLELMVKDGVLTATLETETPAARRVLLDHLPALRERLAEQNIRIERFDVDVRQEGGDQSQSSLQQRRHQHPQQGTPYRNPSRQPVPVPESASATPAAVDLTGDTQINLVA